MSIKLKEIMKGITKSFWQTHFLVVEFVLSNEGSDDVNPRIKEAREEGGMFGVADLCQRLTEIFEREHQGEEWITRDYIDTLDSFVETHTKDYKYGVKNERDLESSDDDAIVKCNGCDRYYYESIGGVLDTNNLQLLNEDSDECFKGCGNCKTDGYLMDLD